MTEEQPSNTTESQEDNSFDLERPQQIDSYCVSCGDSGVTTLLRRDIPFFHDIIIASFSCPHCGFRSTSLNTVEFQERGNRFELSVTQPKDLDREIIRTEYATVNIPEIELEIPANLERKGEINTLEGIINAIIEPLEQLQPVRRV